MEKEIWRVITEFPNYEASNLGRIRTIRTGRIRKTVINKVTGYEMVMMFADGKPVNCYVHRLVLEAFIPNNGMLKEVDHIDRNRANNNLLNLKWTDRSGNVSGSGRYFHYKERKVMQVDKDSGVTIAEWPDYISAAKSLGVRPCRVAAALDPDDMKHFSVKGYTFEFM